MGGAQAPKRTEETLRVMTYEEKTEMIDDLNKLPDDKLGHILNIVQESTSKDKALAEDGGGEEVELDIEALDNKTLWNIKNWLANYMRGKAKQEAHKKKVKRERMERRDQEGGIMIEGTERRKDRHNERQREDGSRTRASVCAVLIHHNTMHVHIS